MKFLRRAAVFAVGLAAFVLALTGAGLSARTNAATGSGSLFLPSSYEQYLALEDPQDVALSEMHIAIADGDVLYLYDRAENRYTATTLEEGTTVSKLGFAGEQLFVAVTGVNNAFYEYDFQSNTLDQISGINCSTFLAVGDTLYTATVSSTSTTIASYQISALQSGTVTAKNLGSLKFNATPYMAYSGNTLYCTVNGQVFYPGISGQFGADSFYLSALNPSLAENVRSVCAFRGELYYTAQGGLYASDLTAHTSRLLLAGDGFGALASHGETLYAVCGQSVREISVEETGAAYTGYEISAASSSVNRLNGAVDTARAGSLLVTADAGNHRVSVCDLRTGACAQILPPDPAAFTPRFVATDGTIVAAATDRTIYTCTYAAGEEMRFEAAATAETAIRGIACVYGAVYYVTGNAYGKVGGGTVFHEAYGSPAALASDVYGGLYVAYDNRSAVRFSEREFLSASGGEKLDLTLPEGYASLRADFEGNLYYLQGGALFCSAETAPLLTLRGEDFVCTDAALPVSFALGFEDNEVYFLYGNFMVKTAQDALAIPTLNEISAEGVREKAFSVHDETGLIVDIPAGTIGVRTDLDLLKETDPDYFPYVAHYRTEETKRGVLLATKDSYALVVLYEIGEKDRVYTANLFRFEPTDNAMLPEEQYWEPETEPPVRYLSNSVGAYCFPCMHGALRGDVLARGTKVLVKGYVTIDPEHVYALVETVARDGKTGYVPASYLTDVSPEGQENSAFEPAYLKANKAGVVFTADDGTTITVTERTRAEFSRNDDGTYTARITQDGKTYTATVEESAIDRGDSDALRISLIIILTVLALLIVGVYFFLLPRKRGDGADRSAKRAQNRTK